jgi:hypothetical protein
VNKLICLVTPSSHRVKKYVCSGTCNKCELRFRCLTDGGYVVDVDWSELHSKYKKISPSLALGRLVGGKVFVSGSKGFIKFFPKII